MHRSIFVNVASAVAALFVVACDGPSDQAASRDYVVHNVVEARSVVSEVFRGDELVAQVVLADGQDHITMLADDVTMVSAPLDYDARTELDRYSADLADAVGVLEGSQAQVVPRNMSECGWTDWHDMHNEVYCIQSWCGGGCTALDCVPFGPEGVEQHWISNCGVN